MKPNWIDLDKLDAKAMDELNERITEVYEEALKKALENQNAYFRKLKRLQWMKTESEKADGPTAEIERALHNAMLQLNRESQIVEGLADALQQAGAEIKPEIQEAMASAYKRSADATLGMVNARVGTSFAMLRHDQALDVVLDKIPYFSRVAYRNLGNKTLLMKKLQSEFAQAALLGEGQDKVIKRIQKVTGMDRDRAKLIAQTEHTRLRSQAREDMLKVAEEAGVRTCRQWSCKMIPPHKTKHGWSKGSRESHRELDGKWAKTGELFHTINGAELEFPGDVAHGAPAKEVCRCYCILIPDVLEPGEDIVDGERVKGADYGGV